MKKLLLILFCAISLQVMQAQSPTNQALGVRLGGSDGSSAELSFQTFIGGNNRLEMDLGFINAPWFNGFKFSLLYHWVGDLGSNFYWYIGAGGSIGGWNVDEGKPGNDDFHNDGFFLDADGQLGLEYYFSIPLQISIDVRPEFGLINDNYSTGFGVGFRYCF